jgi:hypothetical protein
MAGREYSNVNSKRIRRNNQLYRQLEELSRPGPFGTPTILNTIIKTGYKAVSPKARRIDRYREKANKIINSRKK